jgi:hypothetical protein
VLGYFFGVIMAFTAVLALAVGLFNITGAVNGRQRPHPVIAGTVTVEAQRHSPKEASAAKAVTPLGAFSSPAAMVRAVLKITLRGRNNPSTLSFTVTRRAKPPSPSPSITRRGTPAALAVGVHSF